MAVTTQSRLRAYEVFVSLFIAGVLFLQAATLTDHYTGASLGGRKLWPILSYLMYDDPHYEGETIQAYYPLEGTLRDGTVVEINKEDLGLSFWNYLHLGDDLAKNRASAVNMLLRLYKKSSQLTEVRVKTLPLMITRTGQAYKAPRLVRTIPLNNGDITPGVAERAPLGGVPAAAAGQKEVP
jgi:hypothetical protein